jgi:hypothetical protein
VIQILQGWYSTLSLNLFTAKLTVLSSRNNSLVSVYDVSGNEDGLLRSHALPYSLFSCFPSGSNAGFYVAQPHPDSGIDATASLLQLTSRGGIYQTALALRQDNDTTPLSVTVDVSWSPAVHRLATASSTRPEMGKLGARVMQEVDFRRAYQRISSLVSRFILSRCSKLCAPFQVSSPRLTPPRLSIPQKMPVLSTKRWI